MSRPARRSPTTRTPTDRPWVTQRRADEARSSRATAAIRRLRVVRVAGRVPEPGAARPRGRPAASGGSGRRAATRRSATSTARPGRPAARHAQPPSDARRRVDERHQSPLEARGRRRSRRGRARRARRGRASSRARCHRVDRRELGEPVARGRSLERCGPSAGSLAGRPRRRGTGAVAACGSSAPGSGRQRPPDGRAGQRRDRRHDLEVGGPERGRRSRSRRPTPTRRLVGAQRRDDDAARRRAPRPWRAVSSGASSTSSATPAPRTLADDPRRRPVPRSTAHPRPGRAGRRAPASRPAGEQQEPARVVRQARQLALRGPDDRLDPSAEPPIAAARS